MSPYDPITFRVGPKTPYPLIKINDDKTRAMLVLTNRAGNIFYFMGVRQVAQHGNPQLSSTSPNGIASPAQALALDQKMDDGLPSTGNIVATRNFHPHLTNNFYPMSLDTTSCVSSGAYNLAITNNQTCRLLVKADNHK